MPPRLTAEAIRKSYAGVRALKGISFTLEPGEVHALVGENGAGKSTLIRILTGAERPDSGTLTIDDRPVEWNVFGPAEARARGVAAVYQQPALFPDLTVAENIALTIERPAMWHRVDWCARRRRAAELLAQAGASIDPDRIAGTLSLPEQQLLEIARALGAGAHTILMDEPTASLTDSEVARLFDVITALRSAGAGIVYISHRLDEVFRVADRITVLRDGETVATGAAAELTLDALVRHMAGRPLAARYPARTAEAGDAVLEVRRVSSAAAGVRNVSLTVRRGEVLGVAGLVGSGRTELAELLFGLRRRDAGEVLVGGSPVAINSPAEAIAHGIAYVPEDRRRHGIVVDMAVAVNTSLATLAAHSRRGLVSRRRERETAARFVSQLQIKASSVDVDVATLSGGNQQKVALARWLAAAPSVLILDEPTQGVDVGAKAEIHDLIRKMAARGVAIILISSEMTEVVGMSDRIVVLRSGAVAGELNRTDAQPEKVLALAVGHASAVPGVAV
jgi:rhamnose transport system ATP-binding protein